MVQAGGIDTSQLASLGLSPEELLKGATTNGSSSSQTNGSSAYGEDEPLNPSAGQNFDSVASVAPSGAEAGLNAETPEDYWSPQTPASDNFQDDYGGIPPVPNHDGTICLKWDNSLGAHADHFRVCCTCPSQPGCSENIICIILFSMTGQHMHVRCVHA